MPAAHRRLILAGLVVLPLLGCHKGSSKSGVVPNEATVVSQVSVTSTRESPATVSFQLEDPEGDPATVDLVFFTTGSGTPTALSLQGTPSLSDLPVDPAGSTYTFQWDFGADVGQAFQEGIAVRVDIVDGVQSIVSSATASNVALGNDSPEVVDIPAIPGPFTGNVAVPFRIADSSDDKVNVKIEYDVIDDVPDQGFRLARLAILPAFAPTPDYAFVGIEAPREGVDLTFDWDVVFDEGKTDFDAVIRITLEDDLMKGAPKVGSPIRLDNNASAAITGLSVEDTRESPATVRFRLLDEEADPQRVRLAFLRPGASTPEPMTLVVPGSDENLGADPAGTDHVLQWDFAADLGTTAFAAGFGATCDLLESTTVVSSAAAASFDLGNDAPRVTQLFTAPAGEVEGEFDLTIQVADSSGDPVDVAVEYDVLGDVPDAGFRSARPAGLAASDPTPEFAIQGLVADPLGSPADFLWDVFSDEGATDFSAVLRFSIRDDLATGPDVTSLPVAFDNNASARVEIDAAALSANTDGRRGVPIPFRVFDEESDSVVFALQWREAGGSFPVLPADAASLRRALDDPAQRRLLQIASEYRALFRGRSRRIAPANDPNGDKLGLPELASSAAGALATGVVGDRLELLRPMGPPAATGHAWSLAGPVAALPVGSGPSALVLDSEVPGSWRLRELDLSTGEELRAVAGGAQGDPLAMDLVRGAPGRLLLAVGDGSAWSLLSVDLETGSAKEWLAASQVPVSGAVRDVESLHAGTAFVTVDDALVRVDGVAGAAPHAVAILRGLDGPWGLALHPTRPDRLYLAESGATSMAAGGVLEVDLESLTSVRFTRSALPGARSIAVSSDGSTLMALTDRDRSDGTFELSALRLGGPSGAIETEVLPGVADGTSAVALGGDGLVVLTLPGQDDLAVSGGIQQARRITAFKQRGQIATVDAPFDPPISTGLDWRLREAFGDLGTDPGGLDGVFVWDTSDVAQGGEVVIRGLALDTDVGTGGASFALPQPISGPLDVAPTFGDPLVNAPFVDIAAEDLDGDGDPDLAGVADGESVLLAIQEQPGTFVQGEVVSLGAGARAVTVVAADLDGDDRVDLAVGDAAGGVHVLLQSAGGTFGANPIGLAGAGVSSLAAGDVDGDGRPDLVAAHPGTDTISVFLGPDFLPGAGADLELTDAIAGPSAVDLGDLDGDGRIDLAIANETSGDVAIYLGSAGGLGTTADRVLPGPSGARATALVAVDLDRDGDRDLLVGYGGIDRVGIFAQTAPGTFEVAGEPFGDAASTPEPFRLVAADLDLDGAPDLIVSSPASAGTAVFLQGADGTFPSLPGLQLGAGSVGGGASGIAALDVDSDGRIDLAAANGGSQRLEVFYQSRPGDFRSESVLLENALLGESAEFIQPGDYDGDGDLDLALADRNDDHVSLYIQTAPGRFEPSEEGPIGEGVFDAVTALATGDLDDDGDLDLVAAMTGRSQLGIAFQTAPGVFDFDPSTGILGDFPARFRPRSVAIGDLDGDNDLDIVSANTGNGSLSVFLQTAPGVFPPSPAFNLSSGTFTQRPNVVLAVDVDADGDTDIVTANQGNKFDPDRAGISIFLQQAGSFAFGPDVSLLNLVPVTEIIDVGAGDLDGDGDLDLVAADRGAGALLVIEQTAPGDFVFDGQMLSIPGASIAPISVEVADFDGDGFLDIATVDELQNRLLVFVQSAPGQFHRDPLVDLAPLAPNGVTLSIAAADLDSDGDVDLVSADSVGGAQTVHFGGR